MGNLKYRVWFDQNRQYVGVFILIAFGLFITCVIFSSYQADHAKERQSEATYHKGGIDEGKITCSFSPFVNGYSCDAEPPKSIDEIRQADYDLKAQQDMSEWALGALLVSIWGTLFTAIGIFLVWRTLRSTNEALAIADRTLVETKRLGEHQIEQAKIANKAAWKAATETSRIGEAQVRAYLHIASIDIYLNQRGASITDEAIVNFSANVQNSGSSPASSVKIEISMTGSATEDSIQAPSSFAQPIFTGIISADSTMKTLEYGFSAGMSLGQMHERFKSIAWECVTVVSWKDVFGSTFSERQRFVLHFDYSIRADELLGKSTSIPLAEEMRQ